MSKHARERVRYKCSFPRPLEDRQRDDTLVWLVNADEADIFEVRYQERRHKKLRSMGMLHATESAAREHLEALKQFERCDD